METKETAKIDMSKFGEFFNETTAKPISTVEGLANRSTGLRSFPADCDLYYKAMQLGTATKAYKFFFNKTEEEPATDENGKVLKKNNKAQTVTTTQRVEVQINPGDPAWQWVITDGSTFIQHGILFNAMWVDKDDKPCKELCTLDDFKAKDFFIDFNRSMKKFIVKILG